MANYNGTDANDSISVSGNASNSINAGGGRNVISAVGNAAQYVNAGSGDDTVTTGSGNDQINVGDGNNYVDAGNGNNAINAGRGNDILLAGSGNDQINAGDGDNQINAGNGQNTVNAGSGNDQITTGSGNDQINAGEGANTVWAGEGNNTVTAGSGDDVIISGSGNDAIYAGEGRNRVEAGDGNNAVYTGAGADTIITGSGNDAIYAGEGENAIFASDGNNAIYAGAGADRITAGSGNDAIYAGEGNNVVAAGDGNNAVYTGSGNDAVTSGSGNDVIYAGGGADVVNAGGGNDTVYLDDGDDVIRHSVSGNIGARDVYYGGNGTDTLQLVLTADQAKNAAILSDIARFRATNGGSYGFQFNAIGLTTYQIEKLDLVAPVEANNDAATLSEDGSVNLAVLANDTDLLAANTAALRVISYDAANLPGVLNLNGNVFTFVPGAAYQNLKPGAQRTVSFSYTMGDDQGFTATATVTLTITGTNDGPVAVADAAAFTENQSVTLDVLANDTDVDDGHTFTLVSASTPAGKGAVSIVNNQLTFTTGSDFDHLAKGAVEVVTVSYTMADEYGAQSTSTATFTITGTNDGPVALADAASINENQSVTLDVLANDTDVDDGHAFTLVSASTPAGKGAVSIVNNQLTFTPGASFDHLSEGAVETVTLTYTMADQFGAQSTSTVTLTVTGTNDGPVLTSTAAAQVGSVLEAGNLDNGAPLAGVASATGTLTSTDIDDDASAAWSGSANGTYGTFTIGSNGQWTYALDNSRATTQALTEGQSVTELFNATVTDSHGASATQTITITVSGSNDSPVITSDAAAASGAVTEAGYGVAGLANIAGQLASSDVDANATAAWSGSKNGTYGTFTIGADGQWAYALDNSRAATQSLTQGQVATETFTATVTDDKGAIATQLITVRVNGTNDAPVLTADVATTGENQSFTLNVLANDSDPDAGAVLTLADASVGAGKGAVSIVNNMLVFNPGSDFDHLAAGASEQVVVTYGVTDQYGVRVTSTATFTVVGQNDAPVAVADAAAISENQSVTLDVLANDTDVDDGHVLTLVSANPPAGSSVTLAGGVLTFNPGTAFDALVEGQVLATSFTYTIRDERGALSTSTINLTVTGTNDAPVITTTTASGTVTEAGASNSGAVAGVPSASGTLVATDADAGAALTWSGSAAGAYGAFTIGANGQWSYALDNAKAATQALRGGEVKAEIFTATVTDDKGVSATKLVTITVNGTDDAPVITSTQADARGSVSENGSITPAQTVIGTAIATGVLTSSDVDAQATATWGVVIQGAYGSVAITANGAWTYTLDNNRAATQALNAGQIANDTVFVRVMDDQGVVTYQAIIIAVSGANDAPVISGTLTGTVVEAGNLDNGVATAGTSAVSGTLIAPDADAGTVISWSGTANGTYGTFAVNAAGVWTYALDNSRAATQALTEGQSVTESFTVSASDGKGGSDQKVVTVTINGANDVPVINVAASTVTASFAEQADLSPDENTLALGATGVVMFSDVDAGATFTASAVALGSGYTGALVLGAVDQANGQVGWTWSGNDAGLDTLAEGQTRVQTYRVTITDDKGAIATRDIAITLTGANDGVTLTGAGAISGGVTEGSGSSNLTTTGAFTYQDADLIDAHGVSVVGAPVVVASAGVPDGFASAALGTFSAVVSENTADQINTGQAQWTYTVNDAAVQGLAAGETISLTYVLRVADSHGSSVDQPVTITITGTNDAPVIAALTDVNGMVAEGSGGTVVSDSGSFTLVDLDLSDTHVVSVGTPVLSGSAGVAASLLPAGGWGTLSATVNENNTDLANGFGVSWSFAVNSAAIEGLASGQSVTQTYPVTVNDGHGGTVIQNVTVVITGTNDAPTIVAASTLASGTVTEFTDLAPGENTATLTSNGTIAFADLDLSDVHAASFVAMGSNYLGTFALGNVNQSADKLGWNFTLNDSAIDGLQAGQTLIQTYRVTVSDGQGGSVLQDVVVTIVGTNDVPTMTVNSESVNAYSLPSATQIESSGSALYLGQTFVASGDMLTDVTLPLGWQGGSDAVEYRVLIVSVVTDATGSHPGQVLYQTGDLTLANGATVSLVTIPVGLALEAGQTYAVIVDLKANADATPASVGWASTNSTSGAGFSIAGTAASQSGDFAQNWSPLGHSLGANFNFTAAADTASVRELEAGSLGENTVTHSATGAFTFADVDTLDTHTVSVQAGAAGYIGSLVASVKESTHQVNWTYTASDADMARLAAGQIVTQTYTLVLDDGHGGTVSKVVSVRLGGANDKPIIVTVDSGLAGTVNELADGAAGENIDTLSATGVLSFTDADLGSTHTASVVAQGAGYLGNLTLGALDEASGKLAWTFAVGDGAVDFLNEGETRSQSYLVTITDDKGATVTQVITVTLQGAADASSNPAPIITSTSVDAAGSVVESGVGVAGQSVTQGTLAATDALGTEWSGNANGTYGQFAIDASGHWTYTLDNSRSATQALKAGEVKTETFRAVVTDSSGGNTFQNVTVTITGTNDAPVISMPVVANTLPSTVIQTWSTTGSSFAISDSAFRLVDGSSQAGALFGDRPFDLSANFSMAFSLNIAGNFAGNDGLAFVLQSSAAHADAIGAGGTGLGALGIADGIALVFDTTTNLALGYDTAQFVRTSDFTPLSAAFVLGNIQGGYLQYTLDWNATTGKLSLIAGGYATQVSLTLTKAQLDTLFGGSAASVYAGVTAAANSSESGTVSVGVISEVGLPADHAALMPVTVEDTTFAQVVAASLGAGSLGENDIKSVKFAMSAASHAAGDVLWFAGSAFLLEGSYPNRIFSPSGTTMTIGGQSVRFQIDGITHALVMTATSGGTLSDAAVEQAIKALSYSTASDTPIQGQHDVVITLTDTANASASLTAPVMVQSVNDYVLLKQATSYAVVEDSGNVSIDLLTNASDPEGKPMAVGYVGGTGIYWNDTFVTLSSDHRTGIVDTSYGLFQSLAKGQIGTYSIWVYVSDGQNTSTFVEALNVTGANDAPYLATGAVLSANVTERVDGAADENTGNLVTSGTIKYTDVDTIDTHSLSFVPAASGYWGTLSTSIDQANDTIHWNFSVAAGALDTLAAGQTLTQTYNITLTDNNGASIVTPFTVTLVGNNDAPVAVADAGATTQNASVTIDVLANDTDVDQGALLTLASASVASGQGSAMVIDGKLVFDTGHDFDHLADGASQSVSVTYVVLDEFGATSSGVATVTVTGTNDAPVAVADGAGTLQGEAVTVDVLANDTDIDDGAVLSLVSAQVDGVAQGSVAVVDGKLVFDPGHDFDHLADGVSQTVTISYVTSDEHGAQAQGSLDVTVTGTNEAPVAVADVADATQGQPVTIDVIANDTDGDDGAVLHLEGAAVAGGADMGLVTLSGDQLIFTSGAHFDALGEGQTGTASITYDLVDEFGAHSTGSLDVTVTGVNDAPTITSAPDQATGTITLGNGLSAEGHLAGADVDTGDTLTFTGSAQGIYGDFTVDDLGNWTYALHDGVVLPDEADVEEHFAAVLTDSYGATVTQDVTISLVHALANVGDVLV